MLFRSLPALTLVLALSWGAETHAQDHATLPLRLDLVHDASAYPPGFLNGGCFTNDMPTTATGYTEMLGSQTQSSTTPVAPYYGWDAAVGYSVWKIFPSDVMNGEVWACLLANELEPVTGTYSLPLGDPNPEYAERYALVVNAHNAHHTTREFNAFVPPGTDRVLVRLLVGRSDEQIAGTQIKAATQSSCGQSVAWEDVLLEEHPWPALGSPPGIWSRTPLQKASLVLNTGGWRSVWFIMDTLCDGTDERVQFEVKSGFDQTRVAAIEIYDYADDVRPPLGFDAADLADPLKVNAAYVDDDWAADQAHVDAGRMDLLADDPAAALVDFEQIVDDVTRAEAYLWVAGWLGGDRSLFGHDGYEWELLLKAIDLLEGVDLGTEPRAGFVAYHLDRAQQYRRALVHERLGGVPRAILPDPLDPAGGSIEYRNWYRDFEDELNDAGLFPDVNVGLLNLCAAEAAWRDVGGQQLGPGLDNPHIEVQPLQFKALVYSMINSWARHTKNKNVSHPDPATAEAAQLFVKQHFDLAREFEDLGLFAADPSGDGSHEGPFRTHDTLALFNHMATWDAKNNPPQMTPPDYDEDDEGGIIGKWGGEGSDDVHGPGETRWWDDALPDASSIDPALCTDDTWASHLRRFDVAYRAAHGWWADFGALDGELGGGDGDDPEFVLQMLYPTLPFPGRDPAIEAAAQAVTDTWLAPWGEDGTGEYYFGNDDPGSATDVEHSGEYTGNGLWAMLQMRYGDPWYLEYALRSTEYLGDEIWEQGGAQAGGTPWTERLDANGGTPFGAGIATHSDPQNPGQSIDYRRFVNWHMDAEGSDPNGGAAVGDLTLNGRAILPAHYVAAYNGHPGTVGLLRQWAEWWWVVLMDDGALADASNMPTQAKPVGVVPAVVDYSPTFPYLVHGVSPGGGADPEWWQGGYVEAVGGPNIQNALVSCDYVYGALLWRYRDEATPPAERHEYLLPIFRAAQLLGEYWRQELDRQGTPLGPQVLALPVDATPGSPWWTATELARSPAFRKVLTQQLDELENDPDLAALLDLEMGPNAHAHLMEYLKAGLGGRPPSLPTTCSTCQLNTKGDPYARAVFNEGSSTDAEKDELAGVFEGGFDWLDSFFALATTWVSYVDRIFLTINGAHGESMATWTQGFITSSFPETTVSWEAPPGGDPLEIAALAKGMEGGVWRALVVNYAPDSGSGTDTSTVVLRFRHGLDAGTYDLYSGPNDGTDRIAVGQETFESTITIGDYGSHGTVSVDIPADTSATGCGAETVLELRNFVASTATPGTFADPAFTTKSLDIALVSNEIDFDVAIHNVGTADATNLNAVLDLEFVFQLPGDPPPDDSAPWAPFQLPLTPSPITVQGWSAGFTPPAPVDLDFVLPWPPEWDPFVLWIRATPNVTTTHPGDKLENNAVTGTFSLYNGP